MKAKDMREKSREDMLELEKSLAREAFQVKLKNFTNRLDDTSQIRKVRRDLARVKTLLGELQRKVHESAHAEPSGSPVTASAGRRASKAARTAPKAVQSEATK
jgi:large subunit ribosomal protein L29